MIKIITDNVKIHTMVRKEIRIVRQSKFVTKMSIANLKKWFKLIQKNQIEPLTTNSLTFVGHSTIILNVNGKNIITDPILYNHIGHIRKTSPITKSSIPRKFDYILLSHLHMDHLHFPSLKLLDKEATVLVPHGVSKKLQKIGFKKIIEIGPDQEFDDGTIKIKTWACVHDGRRYYRGPMRDTLSFLISSTSSKIFVCGDTAFTHNFDNVEADIAFLPIGCYTPETMEAMHCNPYQSYQMFANMNAKFFIPIHFGTLQLSLDDELKTLEILSELYKYDNRLKLIDIGKNIKFSEIIDA